MQIRRRAGALERVRFEKENKAHQSYPSSMWGRWPFFPKRHISGVRGVRALAYLDVTHRDACVILVYMPTLTVSPKF
jgi:hypothetical protein